jgi:NTP pyrophosphatase (non-canonical NTP hydrolase)
MLSTDQWATIRGLVDWLDQNNGRSDHELAMRTLKVTEEAGEVAAAYIGVHGQNPRKGRSHGWADVQEELCDVIVTAAVALASISAEPQGVLDAKLTKIATRAAVTR